MTTETVDRPTIDAAAFEKPAADTAITAPQARPVVATPTPRDADAAPNTTRENPNPLWQLPVSALFNLRELPVMALYALAKQLSRSNLLDPGEGKDNRLYGYPDNVFMLLLKGAALNIDVSTTLAEVNIIGNKLVVSAHLQFALVQRSGVMKVWRYKFSDDTRAVMEVQRKEWAEPVDVEWTFEQAKKLGLDSRGRAPQYSPWNTQRANMLRRRVTTMAARENAGDVVIAYDPDELDVGEEGAMPAPSWSAAPAPTPPKPAARPAPTDDDDIPDLSPPRSASARPPGVPTSSTTRIDYDRVLDDFRQACETAATRSAIDAAQERLLMPTFKLADAGDRAARATTDAAGEIYAAHYARLRGK